MDEKGEPSRSKENSPVKDPDTLQTETEEDNPQQQGVEPLADLADTEGEKSENLELDGDEVKTTDETLELENKDPDDNKEDGSDEFPDPEKSATTSDKSNERSGNLETDNQTRNLSGSLEVETETVEDPNPQGEHLSDDDGTKGNESVDSDVNRQAVRALGADDGTIEHRETLELESIDPNDNGEDGSDESPDPEKSTTASDQSNEGSGNLETDNQVRPLPERQEVPISGGTGMHGNEQLDNLSIGSATTASSLPMDDISIGVPSTGQPSQTPEIPTTDQPSPTPEVPTTSQPSGTPDVPATGQPSGTEGRQRITPGPSNGARSSQNQGGIPGQLPLDPPSYISIPLSDPPSYRDIPHLDSPEHRNIPHSDPPSYPGSIQPRSNLPSYTSIPRDTESMMACHFEAGQSTFELQEITGVGLRQYFELNYYRWDLRCPLRTRMYCAFFSMFVISFMVVALLAYLSANNKLGKMKKDKDKGN